jgi:hypothetical protein
MRVQRFEEDAHLETINAAGFRSADEVIAFSLCQQCGRAAKTALSGEKIRPLGGTRG